MVAWYFLKCPELTLGIGFSVKLFSIPGFHRTHGKKDSDERTQFWFGKCSG